MRKSPLPAGPGSRAAAGHARPAPFGRPPRDGRRHLSIRPARQALNLIESEACESFHPPLTADEHRRNLVSLGVDLNALVGREFSVGAVRCRGIRRCEPCRLVETYAARPVLRALVDRGGPRADILTEGEIRIGDSIRAVIETTG